MLEGGCFFKAVGPRLPAFSGPLAHSRMHMGTSTQRPSSTRPQAASSRAAPGTHAWVGEGTTRCQTKGCSDHRNPPGRLHTRWQAVTARVYLAESWMRLEMTERQGKGTGGFWSLFLLGHVHKALLPSKYFSLTWLSSDNPQNRSHTILTSHGKHQKSWMWFLNKLDAVFSTENWIFCVPYPDYIFAKI